MIRFKNMDDLQEIADDPELWQALYGFMAVCQFEFLQSEDEEDLPGHDFSFVLATQDNLEALQELGTAEEIVTIDIYSDSTLRRIVRLVYPVQVIFFETSPDQDPTKLFSRRGDK